MSSPRAEPPRRSRARRRGWWLASTCTALALVAGAGSFACRRTHQSAAPPLPVIDRAGHDPQVIEAIDRAKAGVQAQPQSGETWGALGTVLMAHKFHREALPCFAEAEKLQPSEARWPYLQGVVLLSWDPDAAIPKLEKGAKLAGDHAIAPRLRLAHLLLERGRTDEAEKYLQAVMGKHPEEPQALLGMGKLQLARGNLPEALRFLEIAAKDSRTARASTALIATIQQRLGNGAAAEEAAQKVAALPPDPPLADPYVAATSQFKTGLESWLTQADRLLKSGKTREAIELHERAVKAYPESAHAWRLLGQARIENVSYIAAEKALRKAVELAPDFSENHFQLGSALFFQGRTSEATDWFRKAIELRPAYAPAYFNLGLCLLKQGQRAEAMGAFQSAVRYEPTYAAAHRQIGATLALDQRFKEALDPLRRAVELDPADRAAAQMLERAELRVKEASE